MSDSASSRLVARHAAALLLFIASLVCINVAWVEADNAAPSDDDSTHLAVAFTVGRSWREPADVARGLLSWQQRYPPLGYAPGIFAVARGAVSTKTVVETVNVFVVVLLVSTFAAGWAAGGPWCAWIATLAVGCSPLMLAYSRRYFLDVPETAMVAAAYAAFAWSDRFRRLGPSIACGLLTGSAMLTKVASLPLLLPLCVVGASGPGVLAVAWAAFVCAGTWAVGAASVDGGRTLIPARELVGFVAGTVVVQAGLAAGVRRLAQAHAGWQRAAGLLAAFAAAYAVCGGWYLNNVRGVREAHAVIADTMGSAGGGAAITEMGRMFWLAGPLLILGMGAAAWRRSAPPVVWASMLGVLSMTAWIAWTVPADRYVLPVLPCVALVATWWIPELPPRGRATLCAVLGVAFAWQAGGGWLPRPIAALPRVAPAPARARAPLQEMLDAIARDKDEEWALVGLAGADEVPASPVQDRTLTLEEIRSPRRLQFVSLDAHGAARAFPGYAGEAHPPCAYVIVLGEADRQVEGLSRAQSWVLRPLARAHFESGLPIAVFRVDGAHGRSTLPPPPHPAASQ